MKHSLFSVLAGCLLAVPSVAQNLLGIAGSPYGGTQSLYLNPAFAAGSPFRVYLNVAAGNAHVSNNYVRYQAPFSLFQLATNRVPEQHRRADGSVMFRTEYTREILDGMPKSGTAWTDLRGPSVLVSLHDRLAVGVSTRLRSAAQVRHASQELLSVLRAGLENDALYNIPNENNQFCAHTTTYAEAGLTLAATLLADDHRRLSVGITVKRLQGIMSGFLINRGLDYRIGLTGGDLTNPYLQIDKVNAELGYSTYLSDRGRPLALRQLFAADNPGKGWGADLGVSYQLLDPHQEGRHRLRLAAALTDLGGIRYRSAEHIQRYTIQETNRRLEDEDFRNVRGLEDAARVLRDRLTDASQNQRQYRSGLPAALVLNADMQLMGDVFLTATYLQNLRPREAIAMHQPTVLALTPRFESRTVGLAVPLLYLNRTFAAGLTVRLGPVFVGTDNLIGLLGSSGNALQPRGADLYAGLAFAGLHRKP